MASPDLASAMGARGVLELRAAARIAEERGHPQLTDTAKRKILGENLARLRGIDVEAKKAELGLS